MVGVAWAVVPVAHPSERIGWIERRPDTVHGIRSWRFLDGFNRYESVSPASGAPIPAGKSLVASMHVIDLSEAGLPARQNQAETIHRRRARWEG